jgi:UDPglucose--hexose-1-phosphate uridylyltransferase
MTDAPVIRRTLPSGPWTIVAPKRSTRPQPAAKPSEDPTHCHFCPGSEHETEPEVYALRAADTKPDSPGWRIRVVPNKFPALVSDAGDPGRPQSLYSEIGAIGIHEVIIETPDHDRALAEMRPDEIADVLAVYRARLQAASRRRYVRSVAVFRNEGRAAGASQLHAHAQLVGLPIVPARLQAEIDAAVDYRRRRKRCVSCDAIKRELKKGSGVIAENAEFVAFACFSPRFPYETWILPKAHHHDFRLVPLKHLCALADVLGAVLKALRAALDPFPYNLVLQTAPVQMSIRAQGAFHWRLEVVPRLTTGSGFELGSGVFIVSLSPEDAARRLREAIAEHREAKRVRR